ncbi:MAG TPA: DUF1365 domain-containing protein [Steroidobacteraceae bacterium]|nr:DUF1365 domain-containing protein [Steroidobacteraceae bacterium]
MESALYFGWIQHRRFGPARNAFRYPLFMTWLDLAELPRVFDRRWFWSARRPAPVWFRRADYLSSESGSGESGPDETGGASLPLDTAVRNLVQQRTGDRPRGPIRLLTHLRFFGYSFNPVSFYYVFDESGARVETIVAEITNTPWKERHVYVLPVATSSRVSTRAWRFEFAKQFHVSPFMPMDLRHDWRFGAPGKGLHVHMENVAARGVVFDATLTLRRREISARSLAVALLRFPLSSLRVTTLIYWQALKLLLKRAPFFGHPRNSKPEHEHAVTHAPQKH